MIVLAAWAGTKPLTLGWWGKCTPRKLTSAYRTKSWTSFQL